MALDSQQKKFLQHLPGVDRLLEMVKGDADLAGVPRMVIVGATRTVIERLRRQILDSSAEISSADLSENVIQRAVTREIEVQMRPNLIHTINATGVVVHTNLGRSLLPSETLENVVRIAGRYSNLEFDLSRGVRGSRYVCVQDLLCEITAAQAAMVVNNNAAAVLLCLDTIARDKKVIVSRGELIEIGGSFRIPDVMAKSGALLKEVGTTNRTHRKDYEGAIANDTALLLKVHTSNYSIVGFTAEVTLAELVALGSQYHLPVMQDLGSGTFVDLARYGLGREPTVQESVAAGADLITFSADKLLGGPQAGIIIGKQEHLDAIKQNPLTRALRIDKMTLAALESILRLYRSEEKAVATIPTLRMLTLPLKQIEARAGKLAELLQGLGDGRLHLEVLDRSSRSGGGSLPLLKIPSKCVGVRVAGLSAGAVDQILRHYDPPLIGRIEDELLLMDLRTVQDDELSIIATAFKSILEKSNA